MAHTLQHSGTKDSTESGQMTEKWGRVTSEHCGGSIEVLEASNPLDIRLALRSDPVSVREGNKCFRQHFDFIVESTVQPPSDTATAAACVPLPPTLRLVIENAAESMCPFDGYTATIRREYPDTGPGLDGSATSDAGADASPSVGNGGEQHRHRGDRAGSSAETAAAADWGADSDGWLRVAGTELISLTHPHRTALVVNVDTDGASRVHVAYFPPYRYDTQHARLMEWCASQSGVTRGVAATSLDSRAVDLITINRTLAPRSPSTAATIAAAAGATTAEANPLRPHPPRTIWIVCRQHPAETMAEWWAEGFLRRLLEAPTPAPTHSDTPTTTASDSGGPEAESEGAASDSARDQLLAGAVVHVVPCANPDGAVRGLTRTNAGGNNLNREWNAPTRDTAPEVVGILEAMERTGCDCVIDVHGDENLPRPVLCCAPAWSPRLAQLQDRFWNDLAEINPDFFLEDSRPHLITQPPAVGSAATVDKTGADRMDRMGVEGPNLTLCSTQVAHRYDCLGMTLEQCFLSPWTPTKSLQMGRNFVEVLARSLPHLRDD